MSDEGRISAAAAAGPLDDDDLLAEILLRLPTNPSSLVCKRWRSIATDAAFRRRFRTHHRKPPILGAFHLFFGVLVFTSVLEPPDSIPWERFALRVGDASGLFGCRHGRVLIINHTRLEFLVFHPVSGDHRVVAIPPDFLQASSISNGAVLCAADHVHGDYCHSNLPFKVVFVGTTTTSHGDLLIARMYSSENGMWEDLVSMAEPFAGFISCLPCTLVGNALYMWWITDSGVGGILQFDLDDQSLAVISSPPLAGIDNRGRRIIRTEDGGVGVVVLLYPSFQMWEGKVNPRGATTWLLRKTVNMQNILGLPSSVEAKMVFLEGYAEEADAIFISVDGCSYKSLYIVQLESIQFTECCGGLEADHPFVDFYTAGAVERADTEAFSIEPLPYIFQSL